MYNIGEVIMVSNKIQILESNKQKNKDKCQNITSKT